MTGWRAASVAIIFIAHCAISTRAGAQNQSETRPGMACPAPTEVLTVQLYGLWRVEFGPGPDGRPPVEQATVLLEKNRERADSLYGAVNRQGERALLAGDIEAGELLLDESVDGRTISAVWAGQVVAGRCGKEIRGSWRRAADDTVRSFTLTKLPGWD
jgi:hypothetical protein